MVRIWNKKVPTAILFYYDIQNGRVPNKYHKNLKKKHSIFLLDYTDTRELGTRLYEKILQMRLKSLTNHDV